MSGARAPARAQGRGTATRLARAARIVVHLLEGLATTSLVFPFAARPRRRHLTRRWSARLLRMAAIECRVDGTLPDDPRNVLVVANHVSWLDIVVLNAVCPLRFVSKAEVARWPLAGRLARGAGTLFIERTRRRDAHRMTSDVSDALAGGDAVAVFPEGTTTTGVDVLPFKSSLLQAAVDAGAHVLPLALRYRDATGAHTAAAAYTGGDSFLQSFWRVCGQASLVVEVRPLEMLPATARHRRDLAREAEALIRSALA